MKYLLKKYRSNQKIEIPVEYANQEGYYVISVGDKIITAEYTKNMYVSVVDLIRGFNKMYGTSTAIEKALQAFYEFGFDVEVEFFLNGSKDDLLSITTGDDIYFGSKNPKFNYKKIYKTISATEKNIMNKSGVCKFEYFTGTNDCVLYVGSDGNIYAVRRKEPDYDEYGLIRREYSDEMAMSLTGSYYK